MWTIFLRDPHLRSVVVGSDERGLGHAEPPQPASPNCYSNSSLLTIERGVWKDEEKSTIISGETRCLDHGRRKNSPVRMSTEIQSQQRRTSSCFIYVGSLAMLWSKWVLCEDGISFVGFPERSQTLRNQRKKQQYENWRLTCFWKGKDFLNIFNNKKSIVKMIQYRVKKFTRH